MLDLTKPDNALFYAIMKKDIPAARQALQQGADVNGRNEMNATPLFASVRAGNNDMCKMLIEAGAELDAACDGDQKTALHQSVIANKFDICQTLIKAGAQINPVDEDGYTPLAEAALYGRTEFCRLLVENGGDLHTRCKSGTTILVAAITSNNSECFEYLVNAGADIAAVSKNGISLDKYAPFIGNERISTIINEKMPSPPPQILGDDVARWRTERANSHNVQHRPKI